MADAWARVQLGELVRAVRGISYRSEDYAPEGSGRPFLTLKCVARNGGFSRSGLKFYQGDASDDQLAPAGSILMACTDLTRDRAVLGSPIAVPELGFAAVGCFSLDLCKLIPDSHLLDPKYLYYLLMAPASRGYLKQRSSGTTVMHLDVKGTMKMPVSLPPLEEQRRIVDLITSVDEVVKRAGGVAAAGITLRTVMLGDLISGAHRIQSTYDALVDD